MLRCGPTFHCLHRSRQQHGSLLQHLLLWSFTVHFSILGICENRAWGWSITSAVFLFKAGFSTGRFWDMPRLWKGQRGTSVPGCCVVWKAETFPSLPSLPLPLQDSEKQLEGTGWWERQQDPHVDPGKRRGWGINVARGGESVRCRHGLTHSCHPSMPPGCGLGHTFTFLCFSVTFLGALWRHCRALHGCGTAALDGEVPFPKKKGLGFGFAAGFPCSFPICV